MLLLARLLLAILILFLLPLAAHALWWATREDLAPDWASADWSSEPAAAGCRETRGADLHLRGPDRALERHLRPPFLDRGQGEERGPLHPLRQGRLGARGANG